MSELDEIELVPGHTGRHLPETRRLFAEYAEWIGVDLSLQKFDGERATLPGDYAPRTGCILLARLGSCPRTFAPREPARWRSGL